MNDLDLKHVKEILAQAMKLRGPGRTEHLDRECAGDALLRAEVQAYLAAEQRTSVLLGLGEQQQAELPPAVIAEQPGSVIGAC